MGKKWANDSSFQI